MGTAKGSVRRRQPPRNVTRKGLREFLPTSVQKSYFMLSDAERKVLNSALEKYRPGQSEPMLVGGENLLKPALRLMSQQLAVEQDHATCGLILPSPADRLAAWQRGGEPLQSSRRRNGKVYPVHQPLDQQAALVEPHPRGSQGAGNALGPALAHLCR